MKLSFEQKDGGLYIRTDADGAALLGLLIRGLPGSRCGSPGTTPGRRSGLSKHSAPKLNGRRPPACRRWISPLSGRSSAGCRKTAKHAAMTGRSAEGARQDREG